MTATGPVPVVVAALGVALAAPAASAQAPVGYFEGSGDVGAPALAGSTTYDAKAQTYTIVGGGTNMWATRDEFQFAWRKMTGDFIVRTHAAFVGSGRGPAPEDRLDRAQEPRRRLGLRRCGRARRRPDVAAVPQEGRGR